MKGYLVVQWSPGRGQTKENPASLFCGGYFYNFPLPKIPSYKCYTSRKRAEMYAAKIWTPHYHTDVYEIPEDLIIKYVFDKEKGWYTPDE